MRGLADPSVFYVQTTSAPERPRRMGLRDPSSVGSADTFSHKGRRV
jgi:hypothetical protein